LFKWRATDALWRPILHHHAKFRKRPNGPLLFTINEKEKKIGPSVAGGHSLDKPKLRTAAAAELCWVHRYWHPQRV